MAGLSDLTDRTAVLQAIAEYDELPSKVQAAALEFAEGERSNRESIFFRRGFGIRGVASTHLTIREMRSEAYFLAREAASPDRSRHPF